MRYDPEMQARYDELERRGHFKKHPEDLEKFQELARRGAIDAGLYRHRPREARAPSTSRVSPFLLETPQEATWDLAGRTVTTPRLTDVRPLIPPALPLDAEALPRKVASRLVPKPKPKSAPKKKPTPTPVPLDPEYEVSNAARRKAMVARASQPVSRENREPKFIPRKPITGSLLNPEDAARAGSAYWKQQINRLRAMQEGRVAPLPEPGVLDRLSQMGVLEGFKAGDIPVSAVRDYLFGRYVPMEYVWKQREQQRKAEQDAQWDARLHLPKGTTSVVSTALNDFMEGLTAPDSLSGFRKLKPGEEYTGFIRWPGAEEQAAMGRAGAEGAPSAVTAMTVGRVMQRLPGRAKMLAFPAVLLSAWKAKEAQDAIQRRIQGEAGFEAHQRQLAEDRAKYPKSTYLMEMLPNLMSAPANPLRREGFVAGALGGLGDAGYQALNYLNAPEGQKPDFNLLSTLSAIAESSVFRGRDTAAGRAFYRPIDRVLDSVTARPNVAMALYSMDPRAYVRENPEGFNPARIAPKEYRGAGGSPYPETVTPRVLRRVVRGGKVSEEPVAVEGRRGVPATDPATPPYARLHHREELAEERRAGRVGEDEGVEAAQQRGTRTPAPESGSPPLDAVVAERSGRARRGGESAAEDVPRMRSAVSAEPEGRRPVGRDADPEAIPVWLRPVARRSPVPEIAIRARERTAPPVVPPPESVRIGAPVGRGRAPRATGGTPTRSVTLRVGGQNVAFDLDAPQQSRWEAASARYQAQREAALSIGDASERRQALRDLANQYTAEKQHIVLGDRADAAAEGRRLAGPPSRPSLFSAGQPLLGQGARPPLRTMVLPPFLPAFLPPPPGGAGRFTPGMGSNPPLDWQLGLTPPGTVRRGGRAEAFEANRDTILGRTGAAARRSGASSLTDIVSTRNDLQRGFVRSVRLPGKSGFRASSGGPLGDPDPRGYPNLQRLESDTQKVVQFVENATGLTSRWAGVVRVASDVDANNDPLFYGRKLFTCPIEYHQVVLGHVGVYWVSLEEALHSVSVMPSNPNALRRNHENMEEGVVAACIELLKRRYDRLFEQDSIPMGNISPMPGNSPYLAEMRALGRLRSRTGLQHEDFYFGLLSTPLDEREAQILRWIAAHEGVSEASLRGDTMIDSNFQLLRSRP